MEKISDTNNYELMIVVSSQFTDFEIKATAFHQNETLTTANIILVIQVNPRGFLKSPVK